MSVPLLEPMTGFYAVWPIVLCTAVVLLLAGTPLFRAADTPPSTHAHRLVTLDGLRGFLALGVFFHHFSIYHRFLADSVWTNPPEHVLTLLGPVAVGFFFMITGFLFWSQQIRSAGKPSWIGLYTGRIFRIGPLYLAAVTAMLIFVALRTRAHLVVSALSLVKEVVGWLLLGLYPGPSVNGYDAGLVLADVVWTLQYEWCFYLSLPLLALFARRKGWHTWSVLGAMLLCQSYLHLDRTGTYKGLAAFVMLFLFGMLVGSLAQERRLSRLSDRWSSALLLLLLIAIFQFSNPTVSTASQIMMAAVMYLIVSGTSIFGLLKTRAAVRLGDVSYGIYLLQGLVLALMLRPAFSRSVDAASPLSHWLLCLLCAVVLTSLATLTHVVIERPGILAGKRVADAIRKRLEQSSKGHSPAVT